jgi:hypothetical protein
MKVDDLQYDWPKNILTYESRSFMGMSFQELLIVTLPAVVVIAFLQNLILGLLVGVVSFLLVRKFEGLGDRNLIAYLLARVQHLAQKEHQVNLPLILPGGQQEDFVITDLDGEEVMRVGG